MGLQIWKGSLLLADWIISSSELLTGTKVIEMGSGVGVAGIVAARFASRVFLTGIVFESLTAKIIQMRFCNWQERMSN